VSRGLSLLLALSPALLAQQQAVPHAGFVYPAGGRQGATLDVNVGGQFLDGASAVYLSGSGVEAAVVRFVKPITPAQANQLREQLQMLMAKTGRTAADAQAINDLRSKLMEFTQRTTSPAIAETAVLRVTIARDAAPGARELRLATTAGLTNPILFIVGELPEFSRRPTNVPPAFAVVNGGVAPNRGAARTPEPPMNITLPAVVNGQMMPGTVDECRFEAKQGERLVMAASARELMPYISDAVPGWFQATLTLRDAAGKELVYAANYRFHPDPVLYYEVPADGAYVLDIHDSIYRGREDFVYRITVGELPFVTGIFPLGGRAGVRTSVSVQGWNLPLKSTAQDTRGKAPGVYSVSVRNGDWTSNGVPFVVDTLPETLAKGPADRRDKAQKLKLPIIVNGRIERPGEQDYFRFDGRAGEEIAAEVYARRLDSPLDSVLRLSDAKGRELASNDDFVDKGAALITHQADSRICFKLPAKGTYYLQLGDTLRKGGPEYGYRLRVSHPQPDFELRVAPSSLNLRAGATVPVTVYCLRRDNFAGEVALKLKEAPGFAMGGAAIPAGQDQVRITLTAPPNPVTVPLTIELVGQAEIGGREVRHTAVPAEDMMQAFAYHQLVPEDAWMVRVMGAGPARFPQRADGEKRVRLPAGGTAAVQVLVPPRLASQVQLELNEAPDGISIQGTTAGRDGVTVLLRVERDKVKTGLQGNLILDAFVERVATPASGPAVRRRQAMGTLPAVPFEIVGENQFGHR